MIVKIAEALYFSTYTGSIEKNHKQYNLNFILPFKLEFCQKMVRVPFRKAVGFSYQGSNVLKELYYALR